MRALPFAMLLAGCFDSPVVPCTVECSSDEDCPSGLACEGTRCSVGGEVCEVELCRAGERRCAIDGMSVELCDEAGAWGAGDPCAVSCVSEGTQSARCGALVPSIGALAAVCETPSAGQATLDGMFSTDMDTACTGGVVTQTGGPQICIVRAQRIAVNPGGTMTVSGSRALALVSDLDLDVRGTIDVSARGGVDGPGGGTPRVSGAAAKAARGGGGAGFRTPGGDGGNASGSGGVVGLDASTSSILAGGYRAPSYMDGGGGAGGALALISCSGEVSVSGVLDSAGGGGLGATLYGDVGRGAGSGGGSGGVLLLLGGRVTIDGTAGLFANGGSGGGATTVTTVGGSGNRGSRSTTSGAVGGASADLDGVGGVGGYRGAIPGGGGDANNESGGGGGGSVGYIVLSTPVGALAPVVPVAAKLSPAAMITTIGVH